MSKPYSHIYRLADDPRSDDLRMRKRVGLLLERLTNQQSRVKLGHLLEREIGVDVVEYGSWGVDVPFDRFLEDADLSDLFDTIFFAANYLKEFRTHGEFISETQRIFEERQMAFRVDENGTVHPFVDKEFARSSASIISCLDDQRYSSAKSHIERSQECLLDNKRDNRQAIRSTFDAVENLFKLIFPKVTHLNVREINGQFDTLLQSLSKPNTVENRATSKLRASFKEWVDSVHNYRHEEGREEPCQPNDELTILIVSQGYSFLRWLVQVDLLKDS